MVVAGTLPPAKRYGERGYVVVTLENTIYFHFKLEIRVVDRSLPTKTHAFHRLVKRNHVHM